MLEGSPFARSQPEQKSRDMPGTQLPTTANISSQASSHASPTSATAAHPTTSKSPAVPQPEYSGESSAFAHALLATSFLQNAVGNSSSSRLTAELGPVMQTLSTIVEAQKQTTESVELLFPHARLSEDGRKPQTFPTPPLDKIFACLRLSEGLFTHYLSVFAELTFQVEKHDFQAMWIVEFESTGHFTEYVVKVCSPGPTTENELIIVNAGLYWLFLECASLVGDAPTALEYETWALMCRDNLETLLAHMGFHVTNSLDTAYALNIAVSKNHLPPVLRFCSCGTGNILSPNAQNVRCMDIHRHSIPYLPGTWPPQRRIVVP